MIATAQSTEQQLLIDGTWNPATSGRTYETTDPFTGEVASRAAAASRDDVDRAIDAAQRALGSWAAKAPAERSHFLMRAAELLEERAATIAGLMTAEMGGPAGWGHFNVHDLATKLRYAVTAAFDGLTGEVIPSSNPGRLAFAIRKPAGVVASIVPWNAPVLLVGNSVPAALVLGNTIVLKASEQTPRTHGAVAQCFVDAGIPAGVLNLVTNAPADAAEVVEALIAHPAVRRIHFTGSARVGRIIAEKAGTYLKRTVLELGGKAPFVVLADADLDQAVSAAAFGSFANSGQGCLCTERVVVDRAVAEEFSNRLAALAERLPYGDPREQATVLGPLINKAAVTRLTELVEDAVERGARLLTGGRSDGPCFAPTVLADVTPEMRIYREESFGPVVAIVTVDGADEAVSVANDNDYGLTASVFSRDVALALDIARRLDTGMCHINGATLDDEPQMPFGGVKDSGYGRSGGRAGLEEFTEIQWITIEGLQPPHYPISE